MASGEEPRNLRTYGGASAIQRLDDRRQRLQAAVVAIIGRAGWASATVRAVAAEAGIGPRFLYESYSDVDDLATSTYDEVGAELIADAVAAYTKHDNVPDSAQAAVSSIVHGLLGDPVRAKFLLSEAPGLVARRIEFITNSAEEFARLSTQTPEEQIASRRRGIFAAAGGLELIRIRLDGEDDALDAASITHTITQALLP